jgi:hypothetical protein
VEKNTGQVKKPTLYERIPKEGKLKVDAFRNAFKVFFKNQTQASPILKVEQVTINRYLKGIILVPLEVAQRFERHTNGAITAESIYFDYQEYLFDQRQEEKKKKALKAA